MKKDILNNFYLTGLFTNIFVEKKARKIFRDDFETNLIFSEPKVLWRYIDDIFTIMQYKLK